MIDDLPNDLFLGGLGIGPTPEAGFAELDIDRLKLGIPPASPTRTICRGGTAMCALSDGTEVTD